MIWLCLAVALLQSVSGGSNNCDVDKILTEGLNADEEFELPEVAEDPDTWKHEQSSFYVYGSIDDTVSSSDNTVITASLKTADGHLVYKTTIDCTAGTWENKFTDNFNGEETSYIIDRSENADPVTVKSINGEIVVFGAPQLKGVLESACAGEDNKFDLILKVNNHRQMSWIFNAQALQSETKTISKKKKESVQVVQEVDAFGRVIGQSKSAGFTVVEITKPLNLNNKFPSFKGASFQITTSGQANLERFVFGQCDSWPNEYEGQCQKARDHVIARSKFNGTELEISAKEAIGAQLGTEDEDLIQKEYEKQVEAGTIEVYTMGLGVFGNNMPVFAPACYLDSNVFHYQQSIHPDRFIVDDDGNKVLGLYNCCTDMNTGLIWGQSEGDRQNARFSDYCWRSDTLDIGEPLNCANISGDTALMAQGIAETNE